MTGLEPAPDCSEQILNLPRLPFRHIGVDEHVTWSVKINQ
ncbi:MAG: hypothetical protein S4CHLAM102_04210 [Chlamydiia bacterium]|nr:hypothetical protein [Chlamydiia bacterium]